MGINDWGMWWKNGSKLRGSERERSGSQEGPKCSHWAEVNFLAEEVGLCGEICGPEEF